MTQKVLIGIDGNTVTGKTTLARYLSKGISGAKHIELDKFSNGKIERLANFDHKSYTDFIANYYDKKQILDVIENSQANLIILDGCFVLSLGLDLEKLILIKSSKKITELLFDRLSNISPKANPNDIHIYIEAWNEIWKLYLEIYNVETKSDVIKNPYM